MICYMFSRIYLSYIDKSTGLPGFILNEIKRVKHVQLEMSIAVIPMVANISGKTQGPSIAENRIKRYADRHHIKLPNFVIFHQKMQMSRESQSPSPKRHVAESARRRIGTSPKRHVAETAQRRIGTSPKRHVA